MGTLFCLVCEKGKETGRKGGKNKRRLEVDNFSRRLCVYMYGFELLKDGVMQSGLSPVSLTFEISR